MSESCSWCEKERYGIPHICHIKLRVQCEHCGHPIKYYDINDLRKVFRENKRLKRRIRELEGGMVMKAGIYEKKKGVNRII